MVKKLLIFAWFVLLVSAFTFREKDPFEKLQQKSSMNNKRESLFRYKSGDCVAQSVASWDYIKVHGILNQDYQFSSCEKYQGCSAPKFSLREQFELKHRNDIVVPCP